jgi:tyrosine-protein phosphatase SIW14
VRSQRTWFSAVLIAVVVVGCVVGYRKLLRWKKFDVVQAGVLYRSGALHDWQLRRAADFYGVKTVFSFTHGGNADEQKACEAIGVQRYFCYLPGDGVGPDDPYLRFLEVVQDPSNHPVLVHCSAGVQRTGGAVALYRMLYQGWPLDRAVREMIEKGNEGKQEQISQIQSIAGRLRQASLADGGNSSRH